MIRNEDPLIFFISGLMSFRVRVSISFLGIRNGMYMCTPLRTVKEMYILKQIRLQNKNSEPPLHAKTVFQDFEEK